ncbi:hypothetical protein D3C81_1417780 [compost metagenome]
MISAAVGSTLAVSGSSIATVSAGPMPGSTPMAVPRKQPTRAHIRLMGVMATAKPCINWFRVSMAIPPANQKPATGSSGRLMPSKNSNNAHIGSVRPRPISASRTSRRLP